MSSGRYCYLCNGEESGVEESWRREEQGETTKVGSERIAKALAIEIRVSSSQHNGEYQHCSIDWQRNSDLDPLHIEAQYLFDDATLSVDRSINGTQCPRSTTQLP